MAGAASDFREWLDTAVDPFVACDGEERIRFLNTAAERLLGWKREDLIGQGIGHLFPERLHHFEGQTLLHYLLARRPALGGRPTRLPALRRDGVEVLVELTAGASGNDGTQRIVLCMRRLHELIDEPVEPIERLALPSATAALQRREFPNRDALYRLVVENAPLGIFHFDRAPVITACNDLFTRIIGTSKRVLVGLNLLTLRDERILRCVRDTLRGSRVEYEGEYRSITGGKVTPVHVRFAPCYTDSGSVSGGVGIVEDISQRHRAEAERDTHLAQLDTLFHSAPIGLGFLDMELRYVRVNEGLARINGLPAEAHLGLRPSQVLGSAGTNIERLLRRVLDTGEPLVKRESSSSDLGMPGPPRYIEGSFYPVRGADGRIQGLGILVEDVTDRRLAEEERARLYHEAQEAIRVRDDFLSIASHELKTPLTPLSLRLATLERRLERGETVDSATLRRARQHLMRITGLINDLLDASRIEAGRLALHLEPTRFDALVEHVLESMDAQRGQHTLQFSRPDGPVQVFSDPYRLEQVVANLVDNALKYSPAGGVIRVTLHARGDLAVLSVKDEGIGIPPDQQKLLFDRYFRARNVSSRSYGGLGLGLYISRDIMERHGGRIWVESELGRGSTFHVALPLMGSAPEHLPDPRPDRHVH